MRIKLSLLAFLIGIFLLSPSCKKHDVIINAADYGLKEGEDAVPALREALNACIKQHASKLLIPEGKYECYPNKATEKYLRVSNNDNGMKRIVFPLKGLTNFEIDGKGSEFIMHGHMVPFDVEYSENITLKDISINWHKPFYFQGTVVSCNAKTNSFDLKVFDECDYEIVAHELVFIEKPGTAIRSWQQWAFPVEEKYGWEQNIDWNIWFDSNTMAPAFNHGQSLLRSYNEKLGKRYHVEEIEKGLIRIFDATNCLPKVGWVLVVKGRKEKNRLSPAIHLFHNRNIKIQDVNVYHAGGMGLIAERTENISLSGFKVVLPDNSGRMVTTTADATHFVNCRGKIAINHCFFENMLDDASNFHGIYTKVDGLVNKNTIGVRRMHGQQTGFLFAEEGDSIRLSNSKTMKSYATLKVKKVVDYNEEYMTLQFDVDLSNVLQEGSVAENVTWQADVEFLNSTVQNNRARSLLISTQGNVLIEKNTFSSCTNFSLLFEGDATFWYESGPVKNVIIRNNLFKNFGLESGGNHLLRFTPRLSFDGAPSHYYHKNVTFENNTCEVFSRGFVYANSTENLAIKGNTILPSKDYPLSELQDPVFEFMNSKNVRIEGNKYLWPNKAEVRTDKYSNVIFNENEGIIEK